MNSLSQWLCHDDSDINIAPSTVVVVVVVVSVWIYCIDFKCPAGFSRQYRNIPTNLLWPNFKAVMLLNAKVRHEKFKWSATTREVGPKYEEWRSRLLFIYFRSSHRRCTLTTCRCLLSWVWRDASRLIQDTVKRQISTSRIACCDIEEWTNEWFIAYSSSMLDCTWNIKTLKQEHTVQNHSATVSKMYSYLAD